MQTTMSRPVSQTGKQHWTHGLSRPSQDYLPYS